MTLFEINVKKGIKTTQQNELIDNLFKQNGKRHKLVPLQGAISI